MFAEHPVNVARRRAGKLPATNIWLWGQGRAPAVPPFDKIYGKRGAMITAVDLLRGLAALVGWRRIDVPGATGYLDTDYAAKGRAAIERLGRHGPRLRTRRGARRGFARRERGGQDPKHSRKSIGTSWGRCTGSWRPQGDYRILVSPDHPTPLRTKTHSHGAVPFALAGTGIAADECADVRRSRRRPIRSWLSRKAGS